MKYVCNTSHTCGLSQWYGDIILIAKYPNQYEAEINARGTFFHVIVGKYRDGNYLCVPNMDFGCSLSRLNDTFWNRERISQHLHKEVDVESLVCGIKALKMFDENI